MSRTVSVSYDSVELRHQNAGLLSVAMSIHTSERHTAVSGASRPHVPATVVAMAVLVLAGTALRVTVASSGWFYWDDLIMHARAASFSAPTASLLLTDHDGHLIPGAMVLAWIAAHVAPLDFRIPLVQIAVLDLTAGAAMARMVWILSERRAVAVPIVAVLVVSPILVPAATWWSAALTSLPLIAVLAWAAGSLIRAAETARRRYSVEVALATAVGLLFVEKALLVPVVAALVLVGWGWIHPAGPGIGELFRRARFAWLAVAVVVAAWLPIYVVAVGSPLVEQSQDGHAAASIVELIDHTYRLALIPALTGGPWQWSRWHPGAPWADPGVAATLAGVLVVAGVVGLSLRMRGRTGLIWLVAACYPLLSVVAVAVVRTGPDTAAEIMQTMRYHTDAVVVFAAAGALASAAPPSPVGARTRSVASVLSSVVAVAVVASSLVSMVAYQKVWADQPSRDYLQPLLHELRNRHSPVFDSDVPAHVLLPVVGPAHRLSGLLAGVPGIAPIGSVTEDPVLFDEHGRAHPAAVFGGRELLPGPESGCGYRIDSPVAHLPLNGPLMDLTWVLQLNYFASDSGVIEVSIDADRPVVVPLRAGLHTTYVQLAGSGKSVIVRTVSEPSTSPEELCIGAGPVGVLFPR